MRILIIEDEKKVARFLKIGLQQENYVVDIAYDGISGEEMALSGKYDVIILDLMLPGKDGMDVLRDIRNAGKTTPVLVLTAKGRLEDKVEGLDGGADDYLVKPFAFQELLARLRS
ncbi:MAG: response regulator, partial [Candidatus Kryptoniota bacterium]